MDECARYMAYSEFVDDVNPACFSAFQSWQPPTAGELRYMLDKSGLGQTELSKIVGVDSRTVRRWVGGEVTVSYLSWCVICSYCGIEELWKN